MHAGDEGFGRGDGSICENHVLKFVIAGRQNRRTFVDLGGIEQIEHGKMLDSENLIHPFDAETTLAVEEVGDVRLLETGLLGQAQTGEIAFLDTLPKSVAQILLQ